MRARRLDEQKRSDVHIVAFDAISWTKRKKSDQYKDWYVRRELLKAYAACLGDARGDAVERRALATGNWGCGAFKGDPQLKAMVQWLAASMAGRSVRYHPFGDERVSQLHDVAQRIRNSNVDCGKLYKALTACRAGC